MRSSKTPISSYVTRDLNGRIDVQRPYKRSTKTSIGNKYPTNYDSSKDLKENLPKRNYR